MAEALKDERFDVDTAGVSAAGSDFSATLAQLDSQVDSYLAPHRVIRTVRCDACNLEFSSQTVLDSHNAGSKHQKKVKNLELMKKLQPLQSEYERDEISGVIRCTVCNITVNSPQLLATHMAGNKHKSNADKRERGDEGETEGEPPQKRPCFDSEGNELHKKNKKKKKKKKKNAGEGSTTDGTDDVNGNKTESNSNSEPLKLPTYVTLLGGEDTSNGGYYLCTPCNAHCNSPQQITQHLGSKKHVEKLIGPKPQQGAGGGGGRRGLGSGGSYGRGRGRGGLTRGGKSEGGRGGWYNERGGNHNYQQVEGQYGNYDQQYYGQQMPDTTGLNADQNYSREQPYVADPSYGGSDVNAGYYCDANGYYYGNYGSAGYDYSAAYPGQYYGYDINNYTGGKQASAPGGGTPIPKQLDDIHPPGENAGAKHWTAGGKWQHSNKRGNNKPGGGRMSHTYTEPLSNNFVQGSIMQ